VHGKKMRRNKEEKEAKGGKKSRNNEQGKGIAEEGKTEKKVSKRQQKFFEYIL